MKYRLRKSLYVLAILVSAGLVMYITHWAYVPLKPVYLENDQLVASSEVISDQLRRNIIQVLTYYNVSFKTGKDDMILIPASLARDKDTIWNYTTKAGDAEWLETHK